MDETIVALYDDIIVARQVVEDLVKEGFPRSSISLITNDAQNLYSHYLNEDYAPKQDAVSGVQGAAFGAIVGVLTGVLVALASLTIPSIGLVIVAEPTVAGLTGVLMGVLIGGIVGVLMKSSVPEDDALYYAEGIRRGGTLIRIQTANTLAASDIINRYGAINVHERSSQWRQDGWKGIDAVDNKDKTDSSISFISDTTTTRVTHLSRNAPVQTSVEEESSDSQTNPEAVPDLAVPVKDTISPTPPLPDTAEANSLIIDEPPIDEVDTKEIIPINNES